MVFIVFNCKYTYNLQTCQIVVLKSCLCVLLFLSRNNVSFHYSFQLVLCMPQFRSIIPCEVLLYIEVTFLGFIH